MIRSLPFSQESIFSFDKIMIKLNRPDHVITIVNLIEVSNSLEVVERLFASDTTYSDTKSIT